MEHITTCLVENMHILILLCGLTLVHSFRTLDRALPHIPTTLLDSSCISLSGSQLLQMTMADGNVEEKELFKGNPIGKALWDWTWRQDFMKPSTQGD